MKRISIFLILIVTAMILTPESNAQRRDKALFVEPKNEFMDSVETVLKKFFQKPAEPRKVMRADFSAFNPPKSVGEFTQMWHNPPVSQAISGMCWCFSTTSFLESEIYRRTKKPVKLSELYTVYFEYLEKAKRFVEERGNSGFGEGSQANAVYRDWKKYGIVPADAYTGLLNGQPFHDHSKMFEEMRAYLMGLKESNAWNEEAALATISAILNKYIGAPPETITVGGKKMTPKEFYEKALGVNVDDYVALCSFSDRPYYTWVEYNVPDNWWHSKEYYNVPLDVFMATLKKLVREGISVPIWGDVSEPGIEGHAGIAVVPTFDIPAEYIDEHSRQFRFSSGTTGDDHGIHIVGYVEKDGKDWYLIKDSGSGSRNNSHPGYYFYHEDYVKLKMLGYGITKGVVADIEKAK